MLWLVGIQTAPLPHPPREYRRIMAVERRWREQLYQNKQYELDQIMYIHFACIPVVSGWDPQMRSTALGQTDFLSDHSYL